MKGTLHKNLNQLKQNINKQNVSLPKIVNRETIIDNHLCIQEIDCSTIQRFDIKVNNSYDVVILTKINRLHPSLWNDVISMVLNNNKYFYYTVDSINFNKSIELNYLTSIGRSM